MNNPNRASGATQNRPPKPTSRPFDVGPVAKAPVQPIPDNYPRVVPYLCVDGASAAIRFYRAVFGATERMRMAEPDGRIGHAELEVGTAVIMLSDEFPDLGIRAPGTIGGTPVTLTLYVEKVDDVFARAVAAGATVLRPLKDQFYGDRTATFEDPFGHRWSIATHVEDVSAAEMAERAAAAKD
jgi:PhnB protein